MEAKDRLWKVMNYLKKTPTQFAGELGVSAQIIYSVHTGRRPLSYKMCQRITNAFPIIDKVWLFQGIGTMLIADTKPENTAPPAPTSAPAGTSTSVSQGQITAPTTTQNGIIANNSSIVNGDNNYAPYRPNPTDSDDVAAYKELIMRTLQQNERLITQLERMMDYILK